MGKGFGFSVLIPGGMDGARSVSVLLVTGWCKDLVCQASLGISSLPTFLCSHTLCKDQELHWDLHWPEAEIIPLFHMDQHNKAEFPLPYSFESRVEKSRLQTGIRVAG